MEISQLIIRKAQLDDAIIIANLLAQMGYPQNSNQFLIKFKDIFKESREQIWVAEYAENVCGFISISFIPQIALDGDFARVSYFCVDQQYRGLNIGEKLLQYVENLALEKHCDRMELHCAMYRTDTHRFYEKHGYSESPKYFIKMLENTLNVLSE